MPADSTRLEGVICDDCQREKNAPGSSRAPFAQGDTLDDVKFDIELPLDQDFAFVTCNYGHSHGVVREGTQRARNFGFS